MFLTTFYDGRSTQTPIWIWFVNQVQAWSCSLRINLSGNTSTKGTPSPLCLWCHPSCNRCNFPVHWSPSEVNVRLHPRSYRCKLSYSHLRLGWREGSSYRVLTIWPWTVRKQYCSSPSNDPVTRQSNNALSSLPKRPRNFCGFFLFSWLS